MDVSGGSGQPRSGNDEPAERPAGPTAPSTGTGDGTDDSAAATEPTKNTEPRPDASKTPAEPGSERDTEPENASTTTGDGPPDASAAPPSPTPPEAHDDARAGRPDGGSEPRAHAESGFGKGHDKGQGQGKPPERPKGPGGGLLMGRPFGVPVYVAPSWFLVAALITWVFGGQLDRVLPELGAARYLVSLFFAVAFYASVLVHELAHTVAAVRFKLPVRRIQLQFFGGVSEIEKEAETPGREFILAFVGPLLSLVLAGLFYLAMQPVEPGTVPGVLLAGLMISNLIVAAFNLLPGLPLDGGRMLRAVVWKITGRPMSGTVAAAWVGRALAISVLIGLPLLNQSGALGSDAQDISGMDTVTDALLAAILAAIIWTGAGNSLRMARLREHLPELRARTLTRRAVPVETDTPLSEALRRANAAGARALVIVDADGKPRSLVREAAIVGVPEHRRPWVAVSGLAQELTDGMRVSAELAGEDLLDVLRATPATEYLVVEKTGEIYGVLSAADVERAFVKAMARPA
ncbi:site-2 protease family protein [Streptomyces shenzhenensis]|uniref:Peptidase n=1 Tax=Streptomyces shenzhenensis TaxID=943815 RepID=A0A3M0IC70_9ACTN|nr:site-2 protease family protein [Streptomyces shenzhenensis]RMB86657.1 peptidase [Streptomyces shenzhenensis]